MQFERLDKSAAERVITGPLQDHDKFLVSQMCGAIFLVQSRSISLFFFFCFRFLNCGCAPRVGALAVKVSGRARRFMRLGFRRNFDLLLSGQVFRVKLIFMNRKERYHVFQNHKCTRQPRPQ